MWCGHVCVTYCGGAKGPRPRPPEAEDTAGELGRGAQRAPGRLPGWQVGLQRAGEHVGGGLPDRSVGGRVGGRAPQGRDETCRPGVLGSEEEQGSSDLLGGTAKLRPPASKGEHALESGGGTSSLSVPPAQPRGGCSAEEGSTCRALTRVLQSRTFPGVCHAVAWDQIGELAPWGWPAPRQT